MTRLRPKVLLIEEDDRLRRALDSILGLQGIDVRCKAGGEELEDDVDQFQPDLAILDPSSSRFRGAMASFLRHRDLKVICLANTPENRFAALRSGPMTA